MMDTIFQRTVDRLQRIVLSLLLICMVPLLLSVLWLVWDHHVFFGGGGGSCIPVAISVEEKKPEESLCFSTKDHGNLGGNFPFNVQIVGCCQF